MNELNFKKGIKLIALILIGIITIFPFAMFLVNGGNIISISDTDTTSNPYLLAIWLGAISGILILNAYFRKDKETYLKLPKWLHKLSKQAKLRQLLLINALAFFGVMTFGMSGNFFMQVLHYVFTLIATGLITIIILGLHTGVTKTIYTVALCLGIVVWLAGVINVQFIHANTFWNVWDGEVIFLIPTIIWQLSSLKYLQDVHRDNL